MEIEYLNNVAERLFEVKYADKPKQQKQAERDLRDAMRWFKDNSVESLGSVSNITMDTYLDYLRDSGKGESDIRRRIALMRSLWDAMFVRELVSTNPWRQLRVTYKGGDVPRRLRSESDPLTIPEIASIMEASIDEGTLLGLRDATLFSVLMVAPIEAVRQLTVAHVGFHNGDQMYYFRKPKSGQFLDQHVPYSQHPFFDTYTKALRKYGDDTPLLPACARGGRALRTPIRAADESCLYRALQKRARAAGVSKRVTPLAIRRAYCRYDG